MKALFQFLPTRWIMTLATLGPVGHWRKMPGTYGSFVGLIWYTVFFHELDPFFYLLMCGFTCYLACEICTQAEFILQKKDPGCIILDEMVAMPLCFIGLQPYMRHHPVWWYILGGFLLFRLLDIVKPLGIKRLQALPGGVGVVMDDVVAALATCCILHLISIFL